MEKAGEAPTGSGPDSALETDMEIEDPVTMVSTEDPRSEHSVRPPHAPLSKPRRIALVMTLAGAAFLNILSVQSTVIMLPSIGESLGIPVSRQQWITSAYNVSFGCVLLLWGRLADMFGRRTIFLTGSVFVTIVTVVTPFMPNEVSFDLLRALQGLGNAAAVPSAIGILGASFPPGKARNYAFITYSAASSLGSVTGNLVGGAIGAFLNWKWIFWIISMLAFVIAAAGFLIIPAPPRSISLADEKWPYVDWLGGGLISGSLVTLLFALTEANVVGWSKPYVPILIAASAILAVAFFFWQQYLEHKTSRNPLIRFSMFRNVRFTVAFVIISFFFAAYNSYLIFATYFYQDYLGLSIYQTTLRFLPAGVAGLLVAFVTARIIAVIPGFYILAVATVFGTVSPLLFAVPIVPTTTYWAYGFPAMTLCLSADMLNPTINLYVVQQLPDADKSLGGGLLSTANQIGRTIGLAVAISVQTAIGKDGSAVNVSVVGDSAFLDGLRAAEWVNVGFALVTLLLVMVFFRGVGKIGAKKD